MYIVVIIFFLHPHRKKKITPSCIRFGERQQENTVKEHFILTMVCCFAQFLLHSDGSFHERLWWTCKLLEAESGFIII